MYADHTQVYGSCRPAGVVSFSTKLSRCVDETSGWMKSNRLKSNPDKAEVGGLLACDELTPVSTADHCSVNWRVAVDPVTSVRDLRIYIDADLVMRTHVYSEQYQDVSLRFVNYVRSAARCRHPRSSRWWSLWCYRGWTTETLCWSAFQPIYSTSSTVGIECSSMHCWSITWDPQTMSLTRSLASIGCVSPSGSSTRSLCWRTKSCRGLRRGTWDLSLGSRISQADEHCALPAL